MMRKLCKNIIEYNVLEKSIGMKKLTKKEDIHSKTPYLKTTTSKLVENTKAFELTIIKELGKLTP